MPKGAKTTRAKHFGQIEKATGKVIPELAASRAWNGALGYLWQWYVELSSEQPLTYTELASWSTLTKRELTSLEVDVLMKLERLNRTQTQ